MNKIRMETETTRRSLEPITEVCKKEDYGTIISLTPSLSLPPSLLLYLSLSLSLCLSLSLSPNQPQIISQNLEQWRRDETSSTEWSANRHTEIIIKQQFTIIYNSRLIPPFATERWNIHIFTHQQSECSSNRNTDHTNTNPLSLAFSLKTDTHSFTIHKFPADLFYFFLLRIVFFPMFIFWFARPWTLFWVAPPLPAPA